MKNTINLKVEKYIKKYCETIEKKYNIKNVYEIYLIFSLEKKNIGPPFCNHILLSGPREGEECGLKAIQDGKCSRHSKNDKNTKNLKNINEKKIPLDILVLRKDKYGNIYHPATKLAFDRDKNVIGKYNDGEISKNIEFNFDQLQIIQKYTLQVLGF
jgi:hypothetical protein